MNKTIIILFTLVILGGAAYWLSSVETSTRVETFEPFVIEGQNDEVGEDSPGYAPALVLDVEHNTEVQEEISTELPEPYISAQGTWPPEIVISDDSYTCTPGSSGGDVPEISTEKDINSKIFCITTMTEGAAGSSYTTYTYTTPHSGGTKVAQFALRMTGSCLTYDEPEASACQEAKDTFDLDAIIGSLNW